ncbi:MAG: DUF342 domain-containing protein, partial [Planctomycetes bacterium]|nr:DUF342 domain-containing protein [Planctomycetota bacterium]
DFFVLHTKGNIRLHHPEQKFPTPVAGGKYVRESNRYIGSEDSILFLKLPEKKSELQLSGPSSFKWLVEGSQQSLVSLKKGKLKVDAKDSLDKDLQIQVPYGSITIRQATLYIAVRSDGSAWVDVEAGQVQVRKESVEETKENPEILGQGENTLIASQKKDNKLNEKERKKLRVIFDYRRNESEDSKPEEKEKKKSHKEDSAQGSGSDDKAEGKVMASDAELKEGQADGEGEYRYDSGNIYKILAVFICILAVVAGIIWYLRRPKSKKKEKIKEAPKGDASDDNYDSDEIFVIRGNLTSHDGLFETEKTTHILGDVEDGAAIDAKHKLVIKGSFQGATLKSTENVSVQGGVNGQGRAIMEIDGDLESSYINELTAKIGGDVVAHQAIRNSKIAADGSITVETKDIMGGIIASYSTIECEKLGSDFCETEVILGQKASVVFEEKCRPEDKGADALEKTDDEAPTEEGKAEEGEAQDSGDDWGAGEEADGDGWGDEEVATKAEVDEEAQLEDELSEAIQESEAKKNDGENQNAAEVNPKASLRVFDEIVSASIIHGAARLEQKKPARGPVETQPDPENPSRLRLKGFVRNE